MSVGAAVAVAEAAIRLAGDFHVPALAALYPAPPILALAIVGPVANVIDLYRTGRSSPPLSPLPSGEGGLEARIKGPPPQREGGQGGEVNPLYGNRPQAPLLK